jgi:hypothetical protein
MVTKQCSPRLAIHSTLAQSHPKRALSLMTMNALSCSKIPCWTINRASSFPFTTQSFLLACLDVMFCPPDTLYTCIRGWMICACAPVSAVSCLLHRDFPRPHLQRPAFGTGKGGEKRPRLCLLISECSKHLSPQTEVESRTGRTLQPGVIAQKQVSQRHRLRLLIVTMLSIWSSSSKLRPSTSGNLDIPCKAVFKIHHPLVSAGFELLRALKSSFIVPRASGA